MAVFANPYLATKYEIVGSDQEIYISSQYSGLLSKVQEESVLIGMLSRGTNLIAVTGLNPPPIPIYSGMPAGGNADMILTKKSGASYDAEWRTNQDGVSGPALIPFSQNIPFSAYSVMNKVVDSPISFLPVTAGAVAGNGTALRLVADGVNEPIFSNTFIMSASSDTYSNVAGRVHNIVFFFNGYEYEASISLGKLLTVPDVISPTVVSRNTTDSTHIRVVLNEAVFGTIAGHSFKQDGADLPITSVAGTTTRIFTVGAITAGSILTHSYNAATGDTLDSSGNELASFTDVTIPNTVPYPLRALTFATKSNIGESAGVFSNITASGPFDGLGLEETYHFAPDADFILYSEVGASNNSFIGVSETKVLSPFADMLVGAWIQGSGAPYALAGVSGGVTVTPSSGNSLVAGNLAGLQRQAGVFYLSKSVDGGVNWIKVHQLSTAATSAILYPVCAVAGNLYSPKATNSIS